MSHVSSPAVRLLREELRAIVRQTLSLAATSRFRRLLAEQGGAVAGLEPDAHQAAQAAEHNARLTRWRDAVQALLHRQAVGLGDLGELVEQAETYVLLQCRTSAASTERHWRGAFDRQLTEIAVALERLLDTCDRGSAPIEPKRVEEIIDIYVESTSPHVHVTLSSSTGEARHDGDIPFTEREQDVFLAETCAPTRSDDRIDAMIAFGRMLFAIAFGGVLKVHYDNARARAGSSGATLLLRFHLQHAGRLAAVPWELLHDGSRFVCLERATILTRCMSALSRGQVTYNPGPLRILVTISTPRSLRWLDTARERRLVEAALVPLEMLGLVRVDVAPDGTLDTMRRMLRNAEDTKAPYGAWHYIGHGALEAGSGRARLALTDEKGEPHYVSGRDLDIVFAGHTRPRLVVLNACHTARGPTDDPAAIVAALAACGVPAVVAMQFAISDHAAITFAEETYGSLAAGEDVLAAVTEARRAIFSRARGCEWMTPAVFVSQYDVAPL